MLGTFLDKEPAVLSIEAILDAFHAEPDFGLSDAQVRDARHDAGPNKLRQAEVQSRWKLFFAQFKSVVILVLMIAGITAFAFGQIPEGLAITAVLLVNAVIGYVSEYKAVKSMEAIRTMGSDAIRVRRNALVKKLPAVETLGATQVIFTDKTGTLTENKMTLRRVKTPAGEFEINGSSEKNEDPASSLLQRILKVGVLCNNAVLGKSARSTDSAGEKHKSHNNKDDQEDDSDQENDGDQGDPTEIALLRAGAKFGITRSSLLQEMPEEREASFNTDVMMMATYHRSGENLYVAVKGAPDRILEACTRIMDDQGTDVRSLEGKDKKEYRQQAKNIAKEGYRLLALADKTVDDIGADPYEALTFLGLVGLYDPPRKDIQKSIHECHNAGIRVIMATGDQAATAVAIAAQTHIIDDAKSAGVMHGSALKDPEEMEDTEQERVANISVFARVTPEQKLHLIKLMQVRGITVAMTGDGVNDAPALKKADIGVAMGKRGTDAAREVADMVLLDDAFGSIVAAIHQGRVIFDNIRKSVMFMLCTNVAEIIAVTAAAAAGTFSNMPIPLLPLQILYLNVITDVFPALALGLSKGEPDIMTAPPRPREESILTRAHWRAVGGWATLVAASVLGALSAAYYGFGFDTGQAVTISFLTLAFAKLWFVFNLRNPGSTFWNNNIIRNPYILGSLVLCTALLMAAVYAPGLSSLLKTRAPGINGWLLILVMSLIPFVVGQILRIFQARGSEKDSR